MAGSNNLSTFLFERRDRQREPPRVKFFGMSQSDEERLAPLVARLKEIGPKLFRFRAVFSADFATLTGDVGTEAIKAELERLVRELFGCAVVNEIIVTGVFIPAEGRKITQESASDNAVPTVPQEALVTVDRFPVFNPLVAPSIGEEFFIEVGLEADRPRNHISAPLSFEEIPANWRKFDVEAEMLSPDLEFIGPSRQTITVLRNGKSVAARFCARVLNRAAVSGKVEISVVFMCHGRFSGSARSFFALAGLDDQAEDTLKARSTGSIAAALNAIAPDLTVMILSCSEEGWYNWSWRAPLGRGLPGVTFARTNLGKDTSGFAKNLLENCPGLKPGQHAGALRGIGEKIWNATPVEFQQFYKRLREKLGANFSIQIITNEPYVPWEMMYPDANSGVEQPDHLFLTHPVARWFPHIENHMVQVIKRGTLASFVPNYTNGALKQAAAEGVWLVEHLKAQPQEATYRGFTAFWSASALPSAVSILHFAGHGSASTSDGNEGLEMTDGWVSKNDVHGGVLLGRRDRTFVVLNACEVAAGAEELNVVDGWPASLAGNGFGGVLAPIWAVKDEHASNLICSFLKEFDGSVPVGEALQKARAANCDASSTPYAYLCYGDVLTTIS